MTPCPIVSPSPSRRSFLRSLGLGLLTARGGLSLAAEVAGPSDQPATDRELLEYYAKPAAMDDGGAHRDFLASLPADPGELAAVIQGLVIHERWVEAYGAKIPDERRGESHLRAAGRLLGCLQAREALAAHGQPASARLVGTCRHFTLLTVAALRAHGLPARARCGFAGYFNAGKFEDHWVVECWAAREARWRLVDAQLDALQRTHLRIDFDPLDVPRDRFLVAGDAWRKCRAGDLNPDRVGMTGIGESGLWFIAGNVVRDLAALNKVEMLPWDVWGAMLKPNETISREALAMFDEVAAETVAPDAHFAAVRERYRTDPRFTVPDTVFNAVRRATERVEGRGG